MPDKLFQQHNKIFGTSVIDFGIGDDLIKHRVYSLQSISRDRESIIIRVSWSMNGHFIISIIHILSNIDINKTGKKKDDLLEKFSNSEYTCLFLLCIKVYKGV